MREYVIDAEGETLGRVATKAAQVLQAKDLPSYKPNEVGDSKVIVKNADKIKVSGNKADQKIYYRHSGRPGHLKKTVYKDVFEKNPELVIRKAIYGMLPKNKLRAKRLKLLTFE